MKQNFSRNYLLHYKKGVPSKLNQEFLYKRIDAAFISSIKAKKCRCKELGIVAKGAVKSVFVIPGNYQKDPQSDTSNALAQVLGLQGEVVIGDKALKRYLNNEKNMIDLATKWKEKTGLPFVFARLCYNKGYSKRFEQNFLKAKVKIPQYILKKEAAKIGISTRQLHWYLGFISYKIGQKEKIALKKFYKATRFM